MILQASQMNWNIKDAPPDDIVDIVKYPNSLISEIVFSISGYEPWHFHMIAHACRQDSMKLSPSPNTVEYRGRTKKD